MGRTAWDEYQILATMKNSVSWRSQLGPLELILIPLSSKQRETVGKGSRNNLEAASQQVFSAVQVINLNQRSQFQCRKVYAVSL